MKELFSPDAQFPVDVSAYDVAKDLAERLRVTSLD